MKLFGREFPSGNIYELPQLKEELEARGIEPVVAMLPTGGFFFGVMECDIDKLPKDEQGPYLGDDVSGHSIYDVTDLFTKLKSK